MILNRQRAVRLARGPLKSFLRRAKNELGLEEASLTVCLVSDAEIAGLNETFRKKKGPTDVLSFPSEKKWRVASGERREKRKNKRRAAGGRRLRRISRFDPEALHERRGYGTAERQATEGEPYRASVYLGDIAISPATARRYAKKNGRTLSSELQVLILHGVLHLLGYDHETDRGEMDRVERKLRKRLGLA